MKVILTAKGQEILVDDEDFDILNSSTSWSVNAHGYAQRHIVVSKNIYTKVKMHREVLNLNINDGFIVDHIDGNKLNNQKSNLRICASDSNNKWNRPKYKTSTPTSKYKGVSKRGGSIRARIKVFNKDISLGSFETEELAAEAYNEAAIKYFGQYANLNVVNGKNEKS